MGVKIVRSKRKWLAFCTNLARSERNDELLPQKSLGLRENHELLAQKSQGPNENDKLLRQKSPGIEENNKLQVQNSHSLAKMMSY